MKLRLHYPLQVSFDNLLCNTVKQGGNSQLAYTPSFLAISTSLTGGGK
jgi:hypothetical protein